MSKHSRYLRISLTEQCDLACYFCHQEGQIESSHQTLSVKDIELVCGIALQKGFKKFKLTGGEPLLYPHIIELIDALSQYPIEDFSLITNGTLLMEKADLLKRAGLKRFNVTLNTLDPVRFKHIYRRDPINLKMIIQGIDHAIDIGFDQIKVNMIYLDENSDKDLSDVLEFAAPRKLSIVLLPMINKHPFETIITLGSLYENLQKRGIKDERTQTDREGITRRIVELHSGQTVILRKEELVNLQPFHHCQTCSNQSYCREGIFPIRLSSKGELIPCMANPSHRIDLYRAIKHQDRNEIQRAFETIESLYINDEEKIPRA